MMQSQTLKITPEIIELITELDEHNRLYQTLLIKPPKNLATLARKAQLQEIGSACRLDGNELTNTEIKALFTKSNPKPLTTEDERKACGYAHVLNFISHSWQHLPLSEGNIKQIHHDLFKFSTLVKAERRKYKPINPFKKNGSEISTSTKKHQTTSEQIQELINWVNRALALKAFHPLIIIAMFSATFLQIDPFSQGNLTINFLLVTLLLLQCGYQSILYDSLIGVFEINQEQFVKTLTETKASLKTNKPNWQPWLTFFLTSLQQHSQSFQSTLQQKKIALTELPELSLTILEYAKTHKSLTVNEIANITGSNKNTLRTHFNKLIKEGLLVKQGKGRNTSYKLA